MKAAVLCVGTELLFGQTVNTNATYISHQLQLLGFDVLYHYVVGDNPNRLERLLDICFEDCDLVITTGGLGPTEDDLTKETIAKYFDDELVYDEESLFRLKKYFLDTNRRMTENNLKQALLPSKSTVFPNSYGTAPGFLLRKEGKYIISLPGPPKEMTKMFDKEVFPYLSNKQNGALFYKLIRTYGIGESALETALLPLIHGQTDPTIATYAKECECSIRIASKRETLQESKAAVDMMIDRVYDIIGDYIYSENDEEYAKVLVDKLISKNLTLTAVESCTGGMFASTITDISGASKCFKRGYVTYSNSSKIDDIGVDATLIDKHTAVSEEVARDMALKGLAKANADICVSVTGIAGPSAWHNFVPGTIFVGIAFNNMKLKTNLSNINIQDFDKKYLESDGIISFVKNLDTKRHDRIKNRRYAVLAMIDMVYKTIKDA